MDIKLNTIRFWNSDETQCPTGFEKFHSQIKGLLISTAFKHGIQQ